MEETKNNILDVSASGLVTKVSSKPQNSGSNLITEDSRFFLVNIIKRKKVHWMEIESIIIYKCPVWTDPLDQIILDEPQVVWL